MSFSLKNSHIIVNYHYVRNVNKNDKGINSCSIKEFERQIGFLSSSYKIVSIPEVFNSVQENTKGRFCAVTFDDCLKDVYVNAFPVLKKNKCMATIFPIASVFEGKMPYVHKMHMLISVFGVRSLIKFFNNFIEKLPEYKNKYRIPLNKRLFKKIRLDDDIPTANFKEVVSVIPDGLRNSFIDTVFNKTNIKENDALKDFFASKKEIISMLNNSFEIGSHSYEHKNLRTMSQVNLKDDIDKSLNILSSLFVSKNKIKTFSYPHGRFNKNILEVLSKTNIEYAVTIEEKNITKKTNRFSVPRYDTNNIRDYLDLQK